MGCTRSDISNPIEPKEATSAELAQSGALTIPIARSIALTFRTVQLIVRREKGQTPTRVAASGTASLHEALGTFILENSSGLQITPEDVDIFDSELNLVPLGQKLYSFNRTTVELFLHEAGTISVLLNDKMIQMDKNKTVEDVFKQQKTNISGKEVKAKWGLGETKKVVSVDPKGTLRSVPRANHVSCIYLELA